MVPLVHIIAMVRIIPISQVVAAAVAAATMVAVAVVQDIWTTLVPHLVEVIMGQEVHLDKEEQEELHSVLILGMQVKAAAVAAAHLT